MSKLQVALHGSFSLQYNFICSLQYNSMKKINNVAILLPSNSIFSPIHSFSVIHPSSEEQDVKVKEVCCVRMREMRGERY